MTKQIINLDAHRARQAIKTSSLALMEEMSLLEDLLEIMQELGVASRDEITERLEELEALLPELPNR